MKIKQKSSDAENAIVDGFSNDEIQPFSIESPQRINQNYRSRTHGWEWLILISTLFVAIGSLVVLKFNDGSATSSTVNSLDSEQDVIDSSILEKYDDMKNYNDDDGIYYDKIDGGDNHDAEQNTVIDNIVPHQVVTKSDGVMYETIDKIYHDSSHFTQGLTYSRTSDRLFESNGLYRKSTICQLNPNTGVIIKCTHMDDQYFAEGMQVYGGQNDDPNDEKLIQITWKKRKGFIYNATTLERIQEFDFSTTNNEGWGICFDEMNNEFIVSDGSNYLHFWDVDTLEEKRRIEVKKLDGSALFEINELEFVNGKVLANIWYEDVLVVIDPVSGLCESEYDFSKIWPSFERSKSRADVFNGISISKDDGIIYVTGKKWDRMFKVILNDF
mmetsp:Transcript_7454/g.8191  ORF Transcript_7454/g.8191 Transcript_7454/m.8191 type:complete len:385 (-) Transcript_7454:1354-2508(-)